MAYDQHSTYQAPRRNYYEQSTQQQSKPQYQQGYPNGDHTHQQGYVQSQQQYSQRPAPPQASYAAQDYGTFDPYAQDAGNPYGDSNGHMNDGGGHNSGQPYERGNAQQPETRGYGQQSGGGQSHRQEGPGYVAQQENGGYRQPQNQSFAQSSDRYEQQGRQAYPAAGQTSSRQGHAQYDRSDQNAHRQHDHQSASHTNGYAQANGQGPAQTSDHSYGHASRQPQQQYQQPSAYVQQDARPRQGHQQSLSAGAGYEAGYGQAQYQEERRYDPRYQQRSGQNQQAQSVKSPNGSTFAQQDRLAPAQRPGLAPTRSNGSLQTSHSAPSFPMPASNGPKKLTMEEWKAQEKAKMHQDASKPETLPQDNAFPTFPTKKETSRAGGQSAMSMRSGEDHNRPSTATSLRPDGRPPLSRNNSSQPGQTDSTRPSVDSRHDNHGSGRPSMDSKYQPPGSGRPSLEYRSQDTDSARPSMEYKPPTFDAARPSMDSQRHPERIGSPLHRIQTPPQQAPRSARTDSYDTTQSSQSRRPVVQPINTSQQMPPTLDPHPLSPAQGRPTTSDSRYARRPSEQPMSPLGKFAQSAQEQERQPAYQQHNPQHSVLGEVYDGYYEKRDPMPAKPVSIQKPLSREEEIEAEMPDFDSAAPSQTSQLQKRKQTIERDLSNGAAPAMAQSAPGHGPTASENFDFGFSSQSQGYAPRQYQQPDQGLGKPVQPYANETYGRRSMDDTRQGQQTLVNGRPAPQRFYADNVAPRPEYARNPTTNSDPGMHRAGSVPPPGQPGMQQSMMRDPRDVAMPQRPDPRNNSMQQSDPRNNQMQQRNDPRNNSMQQGTMPDQRSNSVPVNPDALPAHPAPVRAGLIGGGAAAPVAARPPPVRNYGIAPQSNTASQVAAPRAVPAEPSKTPVTQAELQQLRAQVEANPQSMKTALLYAKKLVEASKVLASDGGRADPKTAAKNRERYIMEAYKRVKKLVSSGYPDAQFYLADCYSQGSLGLEVDAKEAFKLYQAAAKAGHATGAYRTAVCCEIGADDGGGTARDIARAVQWYRRSAALGETAAMFKVGMISLKGLLGQPRNLGEATTWLKRAAERADEDNPHALYELAVLYETANSTPELRQKVIPDDAYALSMYRQAADLGAKRAQFRLGQAYEYGQLGLTIDHRASIAWYSKAAAQGEHQAELALSGWYLTGAPGILANSDSEAYLWARKAAQAPEPNAKALFAMGYFLETGIGCPVNIEEAKRWYGRAASYKHPKALERLEAIKRGAKGGYKAMPTNARGKLNRKDQKQDEAECTVM